MFNVDLLKGEGIPVRSGPDRFAFVVVTLLVPCIIAIIMFGCYLANTIVISVQKREIANYQAKTDRLSDAVRLQKSFEEKRNLINNCLSEVASSIGRHTQWSPVLLTVAKNMPDSMLLNKLLVKQDSVKRKIPVKGDPEKKANVNVPVRTLQMSISGSPEHNCDKAVRDFKKRLRFSSVLGPKLEDIIVSQKFEKLKGHDVVSYDIDCIFKPGL